MSARIRERRGLEEDRREIGPRFGELGKDFCIVTAKLRFQGCQSSRSWERSTQAEQTACQKLG